MSAELQELVGLARELVSLLNEAKTTERETTTNINELRSMLVQTISLSRRFGLPDDIDSGIAKMQRMIAVGNQLYLVIQLLNTASGPWGWALATIGILTYAVTVPDTMGSLAR